MSGTFPLFLDIFADYRGPCKQEKEGNRGDMQSAIPLRK